MSQRLAAALLAVSACSKPAPIFLWHSVGEGSGDRYDLTPAELDEQLTLIEKFGATPVTLAQLTAGTDLPPRPVVLTFDDGRRCLHDVAMPLLLKHHTVAEVFVVSDWAADDEAHRYSFSDDTGTHPALLWPELVTMQNSTAFRVQSHSKSHPRFSALSDAEQTAELAQSRSQLQRRVPGSADYFAWPYGSLGFGSKGLAQKAGYRGAVTVEAQTGGAYGLKRISVWRDSTAVVRAALVSAFGEP